MDSGKQKKINRFNIIILDDLLWRIKEEKNILKEIDNRINEVLCGKSYESINMLFKIRDRKKDKITEFIESCKLIEKDLVIC